MNYGLADLALARRLEGCSAWAGAESARALGRVKPSSGAEAESIGGGVAAWFGPGSPLSQAQGLGLVGSVSEQELDRLDDFFSSRGSGGSIEVSSLADPGLLPALSRRGYVVGEQTHMLVRPAKLDLGPAPDLDGKSISLIAEDDDSGRALLAETVLRGFFEGPGEPPEGLDEVMGAMMAAPGSSGWLARAVWWRLVKKRLLFPVSPLIFAGIPAETACVFLTRAGRFTPEIRTPMRAQAVPS